MFIKDYYKYGRYDSYHKEKVKKPPKWQSQENA